MGSASSTMSASPAPAPSLNHSNPSLPKASSTPNRQHDTSSGLRKQPMKHVVNASPSTSSTTLDVDPSPSSKPFTMAKAPIASSHASSSGSKQKPIVVDEREEGEISEDEIVEIAPIPEHVAKRRSPTRNAPSHSPYPTLPPPQPLAQRVATAPASAHAVPPRNAIPPSGPNPGKNKRKKQERRAQAQPNYQTSVQAHQQSSFNRQQPPHQRPHPLQQPSPGRQAQMPIPTAPRSTLPVPMIDRKGKGKEKEREREEEEAEVSLELNDTVAPAGDNMSPEEAEQYIDIIRNLISEGVSPHTLVQRGATSEYVMKVCQEIVDGTKKRKALWLETRETPRADSEAPSVGPPAEADNKSPTPEVEIVTRVQTGIPGLERVKSDDSAKSEEYRVERMSIPTIHQDRSIKPQPNQSTSHQPHPLKVESYKPGHNFRPHVQQSPKPVIHQAPSAVASSSRQSSLLPPKPNIPSQPRGKGKKQWAAEHISNVSLNQATTLSSLAGKLGTPNPFSVLDAIPLTPPFSPPHMNGTIGDSLLPPEPTAPPPPAPPPLTPEQILQNTLLETRRKAMESMRRRRAAIPKPITTVPEPTMEAEATAEAIPIPAEQAAELQKSIEEQMADIEKEVLEAAAAAQEKTEDSPDVTEEEQMDLDEPEEGEIIPSVVPTPPLESINSLSFGSSSLPVRPPRGIKRLHAEDLNENRATTAPSTKLPPAKRRPFGAGQRAQRLLLHLDDSDSDSSDDESTAPKLVFTPNNDMDIIDRQRMLEEKESSIRKLKEQIAARMAARKKKDGNASGIVTPMERTINEGIAGIPHVSLQRKEAENGTDSPIPADVRRLTKELVQAEAEAEAMDVDLHPSIPEPGKGHAGKSVPDKGEGFTEAVKDKSRRRSVSPSIIQTTNQSAALIVPTHASTSNFTNYQPLLNRYPQLPHTTLFLPFAQIDTTPSHSSAAPERVDRQLLNSIVLTRLLQQNPHMVACQAELGGGKCADRSCQDLHLDKGIQPTDDDLIEYIGQSSTNQPGDDKNTRRKIRAALTVAKEALIKDSALTLETDQGLSALLTKVGELLK